MLNAKCTKVDLEIISDADIYLFFEKSMKGEISCIFKRYNKTRNKYVKSHDQNKNQITLYT